VLKTLLRFVKKDKLKGSIADYVESKGLMEESLLLVREILKAI
jgi:hypothetical protein